ncbi:MAG: hypothetical protein L6R43_17150 [Planctomycetes bacterium]|nr:hypothetical protein [Planctomycetota bacterium]
MAAAPAHRWRFARLGGFDQVRLETAEDFARLDQLDQKLWAALACPAKGLEIDERTLALVDADGDGRIRAPEVLAALKWAGARLKDLACLREGSDVLPLDRIAADREEGKAILASARQVLKGHGKADAPAISLADVLDTAKSFAATSLNGDGIIIAESAADDATRRVLSEIVDCLGPVADRSGKPGADQAKVEAFFAEAAALVAWEEKGAADPALSPLGAGTGAAVDAWRAVRAKVDDWFGRCRLAAFDPRALAALNRREEEYLAVAAADLSVSADEVAGFPLAKVGPGGTLSLVEGLNPAWAARVAAFRAAAAEPLLGPGTASLSAEQWTSISARLAPHDAWRSSKPAAAVEKLGTARLREILASGARETLLRLVAEDRALEGEFRAIGEVERLLRYHRDLARLLRNFVNFSDFYGREKPATFQAGVLFLDGRSCELCVRVADAGKHAALAGMAKAYLAYCDCTRPSGERMTVAAAFTDGDSDYLMVGRNGVFYDRQGRDWDATITKVVENPISIRQAFWSPYKKLVRMIEEQVAKRAAAAESESDRKLAGAATTAAEADRMKPPPEPKKVDVGTVAALGVAVGALGTMLTAIVGYLTGLLELPFWQISLVVAGIFVLVSTPSMLIAWLKLRQRNLAPILDANGWAVNGRVRLNVRFGGSLTKVAKLPEGSAAAADDPYAEKASPWPRIAAVLLCLCFAWSLLDDFGLVFRWTAGAMGSISSTEARSQVRARMERDLAAGGLKEESVYLGLFPDHPRIVRDEYEAVKAKGKEAK